MKHLLTALVLIILLSACNQAGVAELAPAASAPTATSEPTETPAVSQVEHMLTTYLAGEEIDVSVLSPEEFTEFSTELAERRNAERGINPIIYNNEAYISPDNYIMMDYDGHSDLSETIQMYLPVVGKDGAGNLQILNQDGHTITIAHSADVDWNMVVTDPHDTRIDWPNLPNDIDGGLNEVTYRLSDHPRNTNKTFLVPAILLDKTMGQFFMEGKGTIPNFRFLTVADTDANGEPISFRLSLVIPNSTKLAIEDSDFYASTGGIMIFDHESFFVNLHENSVYYVGVTQDQEKIFSKNHVSMAGYQGLITDSEIASILTHQTESWQDLMLLAPSLLIQKQ